MLGYLISIYIMLVGFVYPVVHTVLVSEVIISKDGDEEVPQRDWVRYWTVLAFFHAIYSALYPIIDALPFSYLARIVFVTLLVFVEGLDSSVYSNVVKPFIVVHREDIQTFETLCLDRARTYAVLARVKAREFTFTYADSMVKIVRTWLVRDGSALFENDSDSDSSDESGGGGDRDEDQITPA
jgi:hypothetical protein